MVLQEVTRSKYAPNIAFQDPITQYGDVDGYSFNVALLARVFDVKFDLFEVGIVGPTSIEARCVSSWTSKACYAFECQLYAYIPQLML